MSGALIREEVGATGVLASPIRDGVEGVWEVWWQLLICVSEWGLKLVVGVASECIREVGRK